jgi:ADP-ribosylglycohydrolase
MDPTAFGERVRGALLGGAVGDALGAGCEMADRATIAQHFGRVTTYLTEAQQAPVMGDWVRPCGWFTDDTEASLSVAESLVALNGRVDLHHMAQTLARNFHPKRGYSRKTTGILQAIAEGGDPLKVRLEHNGPGPVTGNGALMRIAPVGLAGAGLAADAVMRAAETAVLMTHFGEGAEAAALFAVLVSRVATQKAADVQPVEEVKALVELSQPDSACRARLAAALRAHEAHTPLLDALVEAMGSEARRGSEALAVACTLFLYMRDEPAEAVLTAVNLGGDCDTTAAVTGNLMGALHGDAWIRREWVEGLELKGRSVLDMAGKLAAVRLQTH